MSNKGLTKAEWDKFSKGQSYKDAAFLKALIALEKAEKSPPGDLLKTLDEVEKQADALLKAHKGDKPLTAYLAEVGKSIDKGRKEADKALKEAASQSSGSDSQADDEPGSALLDPKRLLAQLNLCKRDPQRTVQFGFVDAKDKQEAVLALSPKLSGRQLFAKLQAELGVKTGAYGTAWVDDAQLMLQLDKPLGGLVKKMRPVVKACGFRASKIVLWNDDGTVFEQDDDAEGENTANPAEPAKATFDARLAKLAPIVAAALKAQHPQATKIRAVEAFAREKGVAGDYKGALAALDSLEKLLVAAVPATAPGSPAQEPKAPAPEPSAAFNARLAEFLPRLKQALSDGLPTAQDAKLKIGEAGGLARNKQFTQAEALLDQVEALLNGGKPGQKSLVSLQTSRLAWDTLRKSVQAQLQALEKALLAAVRAHNADDTADDEYDEAGVAKGVRNLYSLLDNLDTRLIDKLDEALNASDAARERLNAQAAAIVKEYQTFVSASPLIAQIDANGFVNTTIKSEVQRTLTQLAGQL